MSLTRRQFVQATGACFLIREQLLQAQQVPVFNPPVSRFATGSSKVSLVKGEDRRKNVYQAMLAIDDEIKAGLRKKKYVVIKPNNVSITNQLAATNADALRGILDYLEPRFRGPVVIAESGGNSATDTLEGFENFKYDQVAAEHRAQEVTLVDMNREGKYVALPVLDREFHIQQVRLTARVLDPDAYVISSAMLKTHNVVVATMSVKNLVMGSPLKSPPKDPNPFNDKNLMHPAARQAHANMLLVAQKLQPNWGMAVIDGFEGMEGNGPSSGTMVPSHIAIASTDLVAADRVGLEAMGINPDWVGYLSFAGRAGLGQYDLSKIEILGPAISTVQRQYKLHDTIQRQLQWMGPMSDSGRQVSSMPDLFDDVHG